MRQISRDQVHALKVRELGLDADSLDLMQTESLATALRRAAGFLCPCPPRTLVRAVAAPLDGLVEGDAHDTIEAVLDAMLSHGDLLELQDASTGIGARIVYAAPPSFVDLDGSVLLLGVAPDNAAVLPQETAARVAHAGHVRRLRVVEGEDLSARLRQLGLIRVRSNEWLRVPNLETPETCLSRHDATLGAATRAGTITGLEVLDPARSARYYRGRWTDSPTPGRFVGRRPAAHGAPLWCYVEIQNGIAERFVDLPLPGSHHRGCDDAWHLQLAIDAARGRPQEFRRRQGPTGHALVEFFSPVPRWARRRWDAIGENVPVRGCLFAYRFDQRDVESELRFASEHLWMRELTT